MLAAAEIDAIATRVAELLRAEAEASFPRRGLVTAEQVRELLRVERDWVYEHKHELGAVRIGDPRTGALRFEAAKVLDYVSERRLERAVEPAPPKRPGRPRRAGDFELLPVPD